MSSFQDASSKNIATRASDIFDIVCAGQADMVRGGELAVVLIDFSGEPRNTVPSVNRDLSRISGW